MEPSTREGETPVRLRLMAMIGLVGYLLDAGLAVLQRRVLWWRSATQV